MNIEIEVATEIVFDRPRLKVVAVTAAEPIIAFLTEKDRLHIGRRNGPGHLVMTVPLPPSELAKWPGGGVMEEWECAVTGQDTPPYHSILAVFVPVQKR